MSVKCLVRDTVEINMHPPLEGSKGDGDFDSSEIKYEAKASPELDGKNFECRIRNNTELSCDFKFVVECKFLRCIPFYSDTFYFLLN